MKALDVHVNFGRSKKPKILAVPEKLNVGAEVDKNPSSLVILRCSPRITRFGAYGMNLEPQRLLEHAFLCFFPFLEALLVV